MARTPSVSQLTLTLTTGGPANQTHEPKSIPLFDVEYSTVGLPSLFSVRHTAIQYITVMRAKGFF